VLQHNVQSRHPRKAGSAHKRAAGPLAGPWPAVVSHSAACENRRREKVIVPKMQERIQAFCNYLYDRITCISETAETTNLKMKNAFSKEFSQNSKEKQTWFHLLSLN
jgi:hypothetical protein